MKNFLLRPQFSGFLSGKYSELGLYEKKCWPDTQNTLFWVSEPTFFVYRPNEKIM